MQYNSRSSQYPTSTMSTNVNANVNANGEMVVMTDLDERRAMIWTKKKYTFLQQFCVGLGYFWPNSQKAREFLKFQTSNFPNFLNRTSNLRTYLNIELKLYQRQKYMCLFFSKVCHTTQNRTSNYTNLELVIQNRTSTFPNFLKKYRTPNTVRPNTILKGHLSLG